MTIDNNRWQSLLIDVNYDHRLLIDENHTNVGHRLLIDYR